MKFNEYVYQRPDYDTVKTEYLDLLDGFKNSVDGAEQRAFFKKINQLRLKIESMSTLSSIRHSINTQDPFYETENEYLILVYHRPFGERYDRLIGVQQVYFK